MRLMTKGEAIDWSDTADAQNYRVSMFEPGTEICFQNGNWDKPNSFAYDCSPAHGVKTAPSGIVV